MIENCVSGYLCNELFSESNEERMAFKEWLGPLLFVKILLKTAQLLPRIFLPAPLFVSFISFFIKARILLQFLSQAFSKLYTFS